MKQAIEEGFILDVVRNYLVVLDDQGEDLLGREVGGGEAEEAADGFRGVAPAPEPAGKDETRLVAAGRAFEQPEPAAEPTAGGDAGATGRGPARSGSQERGGYAGSPGASRLRGFFSEGNRGGRPPSGQGVVRPACTR